MNISTDFAETMMTSSVHAVEYTNILNYRELIRLAAIITTPSPTAERCTVEVIHECVNRDTTIRWIGHLLYTTNPEQWDFVRRLHIDLLFSVLIGDITVHVTHHEAGNEVPRPTPNWVRIKLKELMKYVDDCWREIHIDGVRICA
jgi:hypothetical protein